MPTLKPLAEQRCDPSHVQTATPHVWRDVATNRYVYEDETNNFNGDFATEQEAAAALKKYVQHVLG